MTTLLPVVSLISSLSLFAPPQDSFEVSFTPAPVGPPANRSEVQGGKTETVKQTNTELRGTYAGVLWMGLLQLTLLLSFHFKPRTEAAWYHMQVCLSSLAILSFSGPCLVLFVRVFQMLMETVRSSRCDRCPIWTTLLPSPTASSHPMPPRWPASTPTAE